MAFDATTFEIDPQSLTTPRERLIYMRDFLRRLPEERFDLRDPGEWKDAEVGFCGSPACIGGWARALFRYSFDQWRAGHGWEMSSLCAAGADLFGLSGTDANKLFFPILRDLTYAEVTPTHAAAILDHLLNTGEVDWSVARWAVA